MVFQFNTKLKDASRSWNLPQAKLIEKNGAIISVAVIRLYVCNSYAFEIRLMNQPRIIFEWHQETDTNDFTHKFYGKLFATASCYFPTDVS